MKIKDICKCCGVGSIRNLKEGDILTPLDGSGMPNGLHYVLFNGVGSNPPFKPVRVKKIEGDTLAVTPLHWDDVMQMRKERFSEKVYPALSWIEGVDRDVFWVYAPHCSFVEIVD
jgi:hypothetical protein